MKEQEKGEGFEGKWYKHPPMRHALIAGFLVGLGFGLGHLGLIPWPAEIAFFLIAILLGGYHWMREGIEGLVKEKEIGIDILMIAATIGSAILGLWDEAAILVFLYGAAEGLEEYTYAKTRHSIRKLLDLAPKEARIVRDGKELAIPAQELKVGDVFIIRPGESISTDGIVIKGRSSVNEAPVTGESAPVEKKEGMRVFAGTMNQEGALEVRATAAFEDNTLSRMIHLVEEAQEQKGKAQLFIEKFGRVYSPLVLLSAVLLIAVPPLFGMPFTFWTTRAIVLLVAAAPCALIMSTPVAIAAGISKAGHAGVLIKGGIHLENLGKIRAVAFDKTGTLTKGLGVVTDVVSLGGSASEVLTLACSIERFSEHPLASAILRKADETGTKSLSVSDFCSISGYGAKAMIGDETIYVGKQSLFTKFDLNVQSLPQIEKLRNQGKTVIVVGSKEKTVGIIAVRDEIRPQAKMALEKLREMNVHAIMLTGDNELTAKAIAKELGINEVHADLKPEDKIIAIKELRRKYGSVAMVGDGINDAPALASASVGIAMGTAGTDIAIEAGDVVMMGDDLTRILQALNIGKRARGISIQNIVFSILVLAVLIPAALSGLISVAVAVFLHEFSEILAVGNGLRVGKLESIQKEKPLSVFFEDTIVPFSKV
jgi:Cd2+/Zn2+-exporting ATPase